MAMLTGSLPCNLYIRVGRKVRATKAGGGGRQCGNHEEARTLTVW